MFRLKHETMNVCQRNVARFAHVECMFDKINDIMRSSLDRTSHPVRCELFIVFFLYVIDSFVSDVVNDAIDQTYVFTNKPAFNKSCLIIIGEFWESSLDSICD